MNLLLYQILHTYHSHFDGVFDRLLKIVARKFSSTLNFNERCAYNIYPVDNKKDCISEVMHENMKEMNNSQENHLSPH